MQKRLNADVLKKGDIILTTTDEFPSGVIRKTTKSDISHAMLCVDHGSVIHAVTEGVRSENTQRIFFNEDLPVHVMRMKDGMTDDDARTICDYVRSKIGSEYSYTEAARAWRKRGKKFSSKQFCSRLVAQGYAEAGHKLVHEPNFCTPGQLSTSLLLVEVPDATVEVSDDEVAFWKNYTSGTDLMHEIQNKVLKGARRLDRKIQDFNDLGRFVIENPQHDIAVAALYAGSGYLDFWRYDLELHPWHYDLAQMEAITLQDAVRAYCLSTVNGDSRDNNRYTHTLAVYQDAHRKWPRQTLAMLIQLYTTLVANHAKRCDVAKEWLDRHGR
ncbi:YiiX/YebB-like N1pC/P60 family cysteine hydrolase [Rhizobium ruizarguesonis]